MAQASRSPGEMGEDHDVRELISQIGSKPEFLPSLAGLVLFLLSNPTDESVDYFLSPSGLGLGMKTKNP